MVMEFFYCTVCIKFQSHHRDHAIQTHVKMEAHVLNQIGEQQMSVTHATVDTMDTMESTVRRVRNQAIIYM